MREIKRLGNRRMKKDKRNYMYSEFLCPCCGSVVVRKTRDGIKQKVCSHKCYSITRKPRGSYNEFSMISGYKYIYSPNHPNCTKLGYVAEHRLIAEEKIGRFLQNDEVVHHINFNKTDNRKENLMILSASKHSKLHQLMKGRDRDGKFKI